MGKFVSLTALTVTIFLGGCQAADQSSPPPFNDDPDDSETAAIVVDHRHIDINRIPAHWIQVCLLYTSPSPRD